MFPSKTRKWLPCALLVLATGSSLAQTAPSASSLQSVTAGPLSLKQAFDTAWARQPEAESSSARREAASARRASADSWTAEPMALELSSKGDQLNGNDGSREHNVGLAIPLWLPGERSRTGAVAEAEAQSTASRASAAQLRTAAEVREAYWQWQRSRVEASLASEREGNARQLAADVAKRVKSGELALADQHQAEGAAALAEIEAARARSALATAAQQLRSLIGTLPGDSEETAPGVVAGEPVPALPADFAGLDTQHPAVAALLDQAEVARRSAELARVQTRANPELTLSTTREREPGESYDESLTLGIRIPFGSGSRNRAKQATAEAEAIEAEVQARLARERLLGELEAARLEFESARAQVTAAEKRARLAQESRGFFEKSFRLGETDLPTRLRIELEATDAKRQAALARLDQAAATSSLRQALGLLPE
ncbi:TolC family protein [Pseudomonas sp. MAP12]|jgi:outer membrane protein TolC|uniref:TolC family protein n=1 Tax=Geopseudomonas aromaticivorans TaxID=2849492 RepID=A0ABS6MWQ9_9GAMM|nr:TolC family protein [Pseudomonas aromaticivorans]MBV2133180.1 TolC family protein [Pseudomonas aromaticivorans]